MTIGTTARQHQENSVFELFLVIYILNTNNT